MKKLLLSILVLMLLSSCSKYTNLGGGGCGVWVPKKYKGTHKPQYTGWRYKTGVH